MNVNCEVFYFSTMPGFKILGNETQTSRMRIAMKFQNLSTKLYIGNIYLFA